MLCAVASTLPIQHEDRIPDVRCPTDSGTSENRSSASCNVCSVDDTHSALLHLAHLVSAAFLDYGAGIWYSASTVRIDQNQGTVSDSQIKNIKYKNIPLN